jgi:hypothetical protein
MPDTIGSLARSVRRLAPACLLLLALATVACGGDDGGRRMRLATPGTREPTVAPTSTALPPPSSGNPYVGQSYIIDPGGDVDGSGDPPPGIDLIGARVVSSGANLVFIWYTAMQAEIQIADGATATWTFELSNGDIPVYDIRFQVTGKEWDIVLVDRETGDETLHRIGSIYRDRLDVPYPATELDRLPANFNWTARSQFTDATGQTWSDVVPDDGSRVPFPR